MPDAKTIWLFREHLTQAHAVENLFALSTSISPRPAIPNTLRKHYRDELDTGHVKANSRIAESLYRKAMGDGPQSVTACIVWLKTRAQWKERPTLIVRQIIDPSRTGDSETIPGRSPNGSVLKTIEHIPER